MFKNYLKIALRQLWKHKLFSLLNIFGLATSISVCLLLIMIFQDQYSYDNFHEKGDQIYRVTSNRKVKNAPINRATFATAPLSLAEQLSKNYDFIDLTTRLVGVGGIFNIEGQEFEADKRGFMVDQSFLTMFSFDWKQGNKTAALTSPRSIVLTEKAAEKFFAGKSAIGRDIQFGKLGNFTVTGIIANTPIRSHIQFDYLLAISTLEVLPKEIVETELSIYGYDEHWRGLVYFTTNKNVNSTQLSNALREQAGAYSQKDQENNYYFEKQALNDIVPSKDLSNDISNGTPRMVLSFFMILGLIIITSACFNYTNLSIARSLKRSKEIGIRKVNGAQKRDIVIQFLGEAIIITFLALLVAILMLEYLIKAFYNLDPFIGQTLYLTKTPGLYLIFVAFSLIVGFLAGIFPAFNIASFPPLSSIKELANVKLLSRVGIRKFLITVQFTLCLIFILTVIIVLKQKEHVLETDLGIRTEHIYNVRVPDSIYTKFAQKVSTLSEIESVSGSNLVLLTGENVATKIPLKNGLDSTTLFYNTVSNNYMSNHGIELIAGKSFPKNIHSNGEQFIIINKEAADRLGFDSPSAAISETINIGGKPLSIIGVTKNFHHDNIWFNPIEPFAIRLGNDQYRNANILLKPNIDVSETIGTIKAIWDEVVPNERMFGFFATERVYYLKKFFTMGSKIIGFVGVLTIIIACLGLLGMVIYTVEGRIKEVGIRKILGASVLNIVWKLSKSFVSLLGIAIILAVPITIFGANLWLQNFWLRMTITPFLVFSGIGIMISLGLFTIVSQTIIAANSNPVEALRNE